MAVDPSLPKKAIAIKDYPVASSFFACIFLYLICFIYLFKTKTEYSAWFVSFFLNLIFPVTMLVAVFDYLSKSFSEASDVPIYYRYFTGTVIITILFEFVAIILTILAETNEKKLNALSNTNTDEKQQIHQNGNVVVQLLDKIKILFVTTSMVLIGLFANFFAEGVFDPVRMDDYKAIQDALGMFMKAVNYFEDRWQYLVSFEFNPLFKAFIVYAAGFLLTFFGIFVRLDKHAEPNKEGLPIRGFQIVNLPKIFTDNAKTNIFAISGFFLGLMIAIFLFIGTTIIALKTQFTDNAWFKYAFTSIPIISIITFLVIFLGGTASSNNFVKEIDAKNITYTVLMFVFALLGTPLVYSIFEMLSYITGQKMTSTFFNYAPQFFKLRMGWDISSSGLVMTILAIIFIGLWVGMVGGGITNGWMSNMEDRSFNMVLVVLICMAVGSFFALSTRFRMFASAIGLTLFLIQMVTKWIGPIAALGMSTAQLTLASNAANAIGKMTDDIKINYDANLEIPPLPRQKKIEPKGRLNMFDIQKAVKGEQ